MSETRVDEARLAVARRLLEQSVHCRRLGSALYAHLLAGAADDVEEGGPVWGVLEGSEADEAGSALALRFMGAVHRLVLDGAAPALGRHYPSVGGEPDLRHAGADFAATLEEHRIELHRLLRQPVQTNEVGRCAALLGGFLVVADETGLPLRLLEPGASAGLNLRFDHYRYEGTDTAFGDPASPVRLNGVFEDAPPALGISVDIAERAGCDPRPIDPVSDEGRTTLLTYTWPDQTRRLLLLDGALEVARRVPALVATASAADWLAERLFVPVPGVATVVFHSIVMQYLSTGERTTVDNLFEEAGRKASATTPLARLAMEPAGEMADVRLTLWPGGRERLIARAGYHGRPVIWLDGRDGSSSGRRPDA